MIDLQPPFGAVFCTDKGISVATMRLNPHMEKAPPPTRKLGIPGFLTFKRSSVQSSLVLVSARTER